MRSRRILAVTTIAIVAFMFTAGAASAQEIDSGAEGRQSSLVNNHRASVGSPQLSVHGGLLDIARRHSARMAADGTIYHNGNLQREVAAAVPNWRAIGENVGTGTSADHVHELFLRSPKHRENVENREWNIMAIGAVRSADGMYY
ncbi:MAG TPA: CAP domain-containing protein, partial [Actinomycetota bacterium]|nr:CAP domain-containing protein [Actinomycetota bacterium]